MAESGGKNTKWTTQKLAHLIEEWLRLEAAKGNTPAEDTITGYLLQVKQWFSWCIKNGLDPLSSRRKDVESYRSDLLSVGIKPSTISFKLAGIRKFYDVAIKLGLTGDNPGRGVKVELDVPAPEEKNHLSSAEVELLFRSIRGSQIISLRDRAILALMIIEGLRRVEIVRLNLEDIKFLDDFEKCEIFVRKKGGSKIFPSKESVLSLRKYLASRGPVYSDTEGEPVFVTVDKGGNRKGRLTRVGLNYIIDTRLHKVALKEKGRSCQALRYTCGHLVFETTRDVKAVQEALRYSNIASAQPFTEGSHVRGQRVTGKIRISGVSR